MRIDIYDSPGSESDRYRAALSKQCASLGIQLDFGPPQPLTPATLTVVFANGRSQWTDAVEQSLDRLVGASALVLPIIETGPDAQYLPKAVGKINAFKKGDTGATAWADSLVDETLSMAWLRRRTRKVFISYRRIDSEPIANQIFTRFNKLGYEVFLDDATIKRGVDFQQELKWWLNDADLLLALCSPRLADSEWCKEELIFAQSHSIGIAALAWPPRVYEQSNTIPFAGKTCWPKQVPLELTMEDQQMTLGWNDFAGDPIVPGTDPKLPERELTPQALERLVDLCARNRTASIRARIDNLLPLAKETLKARGASDIKQVFGDLTYKDADDRQCFLRVLPFRPQPEHVFSAYNSGGQAHLAACAYPECEPKDARAKALRWFAEKRGISGGGAANAAVWAFCGDKLL
jgi:TIR domain